MDITVVRSNDPVYEQMFDALIREVFGFSFAPWFACKLWDERYESYSLIRDGIMLSNVCLFKTDLLIQCKAVRAHQFGAVATRESERGKGFSRLLIEHILSLYPDVPAFLYANPDAADFYPRFGFRRVQTYRPGLAVRVDNPLDAADRIRPDDTFIGDVLYDRRVFSEMVDDRNTQPVHLFHLLLHYPDDIYYLPECGALVVAKQQGKRLFIANVITQTPYDFDELQKELPFTGVEYVEFGFCPDRIGVDPLWEPADAQKEPFFIRGDWNLPAFFCFPVMSAT